MAFAFNPTAYYIGIALPLLSLGVVGALLSRRWSAAAWPTVAALVAIAGLEYWMLISPAHSGVEARPYFWRGCAALGAALAAVATLVLAVARRRTSRPAA